MDGVLVAFQGDDDDDYDYEYDTPKNVNLVSDSETRFLWKNVVFVLAQCSSVTIYRFHVVAYFRSSHTFSLIDHRTGRVPLASVVVVTKTRIKAWCHMKNDYTPMAKVSLLCCLRWQANNLGLESPTKYAPAIEPTWTTSSCPLKI